MESGNLFVLPVQLDRDASQTPSELESFNELPAGLEGNPVATSTSTETDPTLPPPLFNSGAGPQIGLFGRKRTREGSFADSSDPPVFSSDDVSASIENYDGSRRKRQYRGTWWGEKADKSIQTVMDIDGGKPQGKREFKRNIDSAVWMGSDDTDFGAMVDLDVELASYDTLHKTLEEINHTDDYGARGRKAWEIPIFPYWQQQPRDLTEFHIAQRDASMYVESCVEAGRQTVDLTGRALEELLCSTICPLHSLTIPVPHRLPPSQESYEPLEPSIILFLGNNSLTSLPGELYKLRNIKHLSVRQNCLTEIMPSIAKLEKMEELNVSGNMLRWLPWEILQLTRHNLKITCLHPNPFIEPVSNRTSSIDSAKQKLRWVTGPPRTIATTRIAYLDITGIPVRGSPPAPSSLADYYPSAVATDGELISNPWHQQGNHIPSLLEIALRGCSESSVLEQLPLYLTEDDPQSLSHLLQHAWKVKSAGGKLCSVCGKAYIIPRTEWIEWRSSLSRHFRDPVPLIRKGCSWACVVKFDAVPADWRNCGWKSAVETDRAPVE